jgi:hypothetical protein
MTYTLSQRSQLPGLSALGVSHDPDAGTLAVGSAQWPIQRHVAAGRGMALSPLFPFFCCQ